VCAALTLCPIFRFVLFARDAVWSCPPSDPTAPALQPQVSDACMVQLLPASRSHDFPCLGSDLLPVLCFPAVDSTMVAHQLVSARLVDESLETVLSCQPCFLWCVWGWLLLTWWLMGIGSCFMFFVLLYPAHKRPLSADDGHDEDGSHGEWCC
jgi:hypothetical protein